MKKIMFFISAALLFTISCTEFPEETNIDFKAGPKVEITIVDVKTVNVAYNADSTISFRLKVSNDASYISYILVEEDEPQEVDPLNVLRLIPAGIQKETFKYAELTDGEVIITVENLTPFTIYQIYAVSGHKDGGVGELTVGNVTTTDNLPPRLLSYSITDRTMSINFSEPIQRGSGKIFGTYYLQTPIGSLVDELIIEDEDLTFDGNVMSIDFPETYPPGSNVCITWEDDAVKDKIGLPISEFTDKGFIPGQGSGTGWQGCYVRMPFELWDFEGPEEVERFDDINTFRIILTSDPTLLPITRTNYNVYITYTNYNNSGVITNQIITRLGSANNYQISSDGTVSITLPQQPNRNAFISITIDDNTFVDRFGNGNEAFELNDMYQYVGN